MKDKNKKKCHRFHIFDDIHIFGDKFQFQSTASNGTQNEEDKNMKFDSHKRFFLSVEIEVCRIASHTLLSLFCAIFRQIMPSI